MEFVYENDFTRAIDKLISQRIEETRVDYEKRDEISLFDSLYDLKYTHHRLTLVITLLESWRNDDAA